MTKEKDVGENSGARTIGLQRVRGESRRDAELEEGLLASSERERELLGESREGKESLTLEKEGRV